MNILDQNDPEIHYFDFDTDCAYYEIEAIKDTFTNNHKDLKIIHINIRSFNKNGDELLLLLQRLGVQFSVIILSETWLNDKHTWLDIPGYAAYHCRRPNGRGGGISILVRSEFNVELVQELSVNNGIIESCAISLYTPVGNYTVIGIYRPPGSPLLLFSDCLAELLRNDKIVAEFTIFAGDFNIDIGEDNPPDTTINFLNTLNSHHFIPVITIPTRVTSVSSTVIDHIWCNSANDLCKSGVIVSDITDHYPVFILIPEVFQSHNQYVERLFRCHSAANIEALHGEVSNIVSDFAMYDSFDIDTRCKVFVDKLVDAYNSACPINRKRISRKRAVAPWLTGALLRSINEKHRLYKLSLRDPELLPRYRRYRNILSSAIRNAKKTYFNNKFEDCRASLKKTWKCINNLLRPNSKDSNTIKLKIDNSVISNPIVVANEFNNYFVTIASKLKREIPSTRINPLRYVERHNNSFVYMPVDTSEVVSGIKSLRSKSSHISCIPTFIFKSMAHIVSPLIACLINSSFLEGVFPDNLKIARVVPLYKAGSKQDVNNYRPISILNTMSKIFEKLIYKRVSGYLAKFNIISENQFGFRNNCSTADAVLSFTNQVYDSLRNKNSFIAIFLDFSKAFDTVQHDLLLSKLEKLGFRGCAFSWFQSYLSNRYQYVALQGEESDKKKIIAGIPQGSILGPLLFLLYINDMANVSNVLQCVHFADDTTLFFEASSVRRCAAVINSELRKINTWLCANKLSVNFKKTYYMLFTNSQFVPNISIRLRGKEVKRINNVKFLGVLLDEKLNFSYHIRHVSRKLAVACGIMRKLALFIPSHALRKIYFAIAYPYLVYGVEVWGNSSMHLLTKLSRVQDRCIELIYPGVEIPFSYQLNNLLPLDKIFQYYALIKFYQYHISKRSLFFHRKLDMQKCVHRYETRFSGNDNLNLPAVRLASCLHSFLYQATRLWNLLARDVKSSITVHSFKSKLRNCIGSLVM